jgi:hypothetical protein
LLVELHIMKTHGTGIKTIQMVMINGTFLHFKLLKTCLRCYASMHFSIRIINQFFSYYVVK